MKIYNYSLIVVFFFATILTAFAQQEDREANFHFKSENYPVAIKLYEKLYAKDTANKEYNYKLGYSYLQCNNNPPAALTHLLIVQDDHKTDAEFQFLLGRAYLYNYKFGKAKTCFDAAKNLAGKDEDLKTNAETWHQMSENAERMVKSPLDVTFVNMGKYINTDMDEITPFVTPDNDMLLYTTNKKYDSKFFIYINNVYYSMHDNGVFKKGKPLGAVNSVDDEFMAGISLNNENIYVQLQGFEGFQDLVCSERKLKGFRGKEGLGDNVNSKFAEFAACETVTGDTLFFSSNREGGMGGMDIYYSLKLPTGDWGIARNAGDKINSPYDDDFPVLSTDESKMYFTSNRPESMGGYDIFECDINETTHEFGEPKNIGYPLNNVFDNKTIAFSDNERYAYVSAIKPDGFGYNDLYQVIFNQKDPSVKILIFDFKKQEGENLVPFATADTTLKIMSYQKGKVEFGEYAYDTINSRATIAFPPGTYNVEITGKNIETNAQKVVVPDEPTGNKIDKQEVILQLKK